MSVLIPSVSVLPFYTPEELKALGFAFVGENVKVFKQAVLVNPANIHLGHGCQIDDFVHIIASSKVHIGNRVHIATQCTITGGGQFTIEDYAGLAAGCRLITGSDDFLGKGMTNPCVPERYRVVHRSFIHLKKHALLATNTIVFPGVTVEEGTATSAATVLTKNTEAWKVYRGNPAEVACRRKSAKILELEQQLIADLGY